MDWGSAVDVEGAVDISGATLDDDSRLEELLLLLDSAIIFSTHEPACVLWHDVISLSVDWSVLEIDH